MSTAPATAQLTQYPPDQTRVGRGILIAIGFHVFAAALICLILYILGIVSLRELLEKGGAIATSGPAPEQQMIVELKLDDIKPPPTDHIEFVKQVLIPKPIPKPIPPPKPVTKPVPKVVKVQPKYTAPRATGQGNSNAVSGAIAGTSNLPHPSYPYDALQAGLGGTVTVHVVFDASGGISSADIAGSSGVTELDTYTRNFIYGHWKNASLANRTYTVPIVYDPRSGAVH
jgi:TonB family protein